MSKLETSESFLTCLCYGYAELRLKSSLTSQTPGSYHATLPSPGSEAAGVTATTHPSCSNHKVITEGKSPL